MSIAGPDAEKCELITPVLEYEDIPVLQELLRLLRKAGAVSNPSVGAGVHLHIARKEGFSVKDVKNLVNTIYSRGRLMSKATGGDFRVSDKLVEELKEYGSTVEEVLRIIRSAGEDWLNGLKFEEDKVVFTGFPATEDALKTRAYILLAAAINQSSLEQKRI